MNEVLLIGMTLGVSAACFAIVLWRYRLRRIFLDPTNFFLLNTSLYFTFQVPFIFFPGNLYMIGRHYSLLWTEIWACFGYEALFLFLSLGVLFFLNSGYCSPRLDGVSRRMIGACSYLFSGHRLYLFFLIPVILLLVFFTLKFGAALLLVDSEGTAKARTVILRDAASFRFLFNFASTALSFILFYLILLLVEKGRLRRYGQFIALLSVFLVGFLAGFVVTGTRSFVLNPLINALLPCIMFSPKYNKAWKVAISGLVLILAASALDIIRSKNAEFFLFNIFFKGNTFADFRDFVWSYMHFTGSGMEYWWGKTHFASWVSFIPASIFPFREEWAMGRAILRVVGWSSTDHFGIRPGLAGGYYFNGGVMMVALAGALRGVSMFFNQKIFDQLMAREGTLFGKCMIFFFTDQLLGLAFFVLSNNSLWPVYIYVMMLVTSAVGMALLGRKKVISNHEARTHFARREL